MTKTSILAALLCGTAISFAGPAAAQEQVPITEAVTSPPADQPDPSDTTADQAIANAAPVDDAQAKIELLQQQVEALQESLAEMQKAMVKTTPSWKGAPELADKDAGFSFKPRGLLQFDAGFVGYPNGDERRGTISGLNYANLGFNARARRLVIGAQGSLPGGFKYNAEFNFAQGGVDYEDITLSYDFKDSPLTVTVGNFYPFSSLETMTSSRLTSMLERASFTDAFNYNRRLGVALSLLDRTADKYTFSAGLFGQPINDASFTRTGWEAAARATYSPTVGIGLLHLGASVHYRQNNRESQAQQYRSRPLTQITDQRFVDTGGLASKGDASVGLELGGIFKSLHFAAEAQKLWVRDAYDAAEIAEILADPESNRGFGSGSVAALNGNPSFNGGYVELGYYLTGETRGYKNGKWDRTKVLRPFDQGGWGAIQLNGRVDYVDLSDRVDGGTIAAPFYVNGGKQLGYQLSLVWNPMDYVRFMAQYGRVNITGGPRAGAVEPTSSDPLNKRDFHVYTAAVRAQVDF